ncbi:MAG: PSD1 and planctomycete cytochrome C domain-containing protein [Planctomycetota bacterium]
MSLNRESRLLAVLVAISSVLVTTASANDKEKLDFFEAKIRPLLIEHCYDCHSEESGESEGNLFVDSAAGLLKGGSFGPALIPGKPDQSLLVRAVRYDNAKLQMPPEEKLDAEAIALLEKWVSMGAPDPRVTDSPVSSESEVTFDPSSHWAFQRPSLMPSNGDVDPTDRDVIDSAARASAGNAGVAIADACDDETLARRLYHDLTGLPPTNEQIDFFVSSSRPNKTERLVDELLATPAFAERFARHWMDVARYADTVGYALGGKERRLIGSERYRDWLIRSFAQDLPYDEMIRLQLAADRHDPDNENGHLDAMGFLTIGRRYLNRFDTIDDRIDVITRGLLGMTVTCARCHDHKFDPIPTKDYYSLVGVFESSEAKQDGTSPLMLVDKAKPRDSHVFLRGQVGARGEVAPRQYLTALRKPEEPKFTDGSGRLELAEKIASADNPLVARVLVNRLWSHLIGRPFVDSTSDFGVRTTAPELVAVLDELAAEFSEHWSVKRLVRRIVTLRLYAQSVDVTNAELDPENRLAARGNRKRKDFESMRDSMLSVCGSLDRQMGGPSVDIHLATPVARRTLYARIDRQNLPSLFRTFDFASPDAHTPKRLKTTVPQQALFLLNHPQMGSLASSLAARIRMQPDTAIQVDSAFQAVLGREPTAAEREHSLRFLDVPAREREERFDPRRAWQFGTSPTHEKSRVTDFRPFTHFTGSSWQMGDALPAKNEYNWASLSAKNGHPGSNHAVVRRWTAPESGEMSISGQVGHTSKMGDGIELAIWVGEKRIWKINQKGGNRPFSGLRGWIEKGQTVDIVVSPKATPNHDSFFLECKLSLDAKGRLFDGDSVKDFSGPLENEDDGLDRLTQLVQTLLLSNEFLFVD